MKKFIASIAFIAAFGFFALYQNGAAQRQPITTIVDTSSGTSAPVPKTKAVPPPKKPIASAVSQGTYRDGTYTGVSADAYYGNVQVRATVANGRIANVTFLDYPHDRSTSQRINSYAMPQLVQESITAQNAHVNGVSGATDTSDAFRQSLSSALNQAV